MRLRPGTERIRSTANADPLGGRQGNRECRWSAGPGVSDVPVLPAARSAGPRTQSVSLCIPGALFGGTAGLQAENNARGAAARCLSRGRHSAADAGLLPEDRLARHLGAAPRALPGIDRDLSPPTGEDDV